jgi:hypothetical protein
LGNQVIAVITTLQNCATTNIGHWPSAKIHYYITGNHLEPLLLTLTDDKC